MNDTKAKEEKVVIEDEKHGFIYGLNDNPPWYLTIFFALQVIMWLIFEKDKFCYRVIRLCITGEYQTNLLLERQLSNYIASLSLLGNESAFLIFTSSLETV